MIRQEPIRENPADSISWFDGAIDCLLVGLLAFMPLAFGVVHAWSEEVVVLLSGAIVICFLLKLVVECDQRITWSWVYAAILAFLLLVVFQLVPLPANHRYILKNARAVRNTHTPAAARQKRSFHPRTASGRPAT